MKCKNCNNWNGSKTDVCATCKLEKGLIGRNYDELCSKFMLKKEPGIKYDDGKLDWTLLPFSSLKDVVRVLMFGEGKYKRDNWQEVKPKERYLKAAFRHLIDYTEGETLDKETSITHLAHCVCCLLFLIWHDKQKVGD